MRGWIESIRFKTFYLWVVALQGADLVSTYAAFSTGLAVEKNQLLVQAADRSGLTIEAVVLLSKWIVVVVFALAYRQTKDNYFDRLLMLGLIVFYLYVCATNFFWAFYLANMSL